MNEILVTVKEVYGRRLIYPADRAAQLLCEIKGRVTLDWADLDRIKALGFTVTEVPRISYIPVGSAYTGEQK